MIRVLIVGGKLQGIEIAYLAKKTGYFSILVDKNRNAPARGLADRFINCDVFSAEKILGLFKEADVVIPAIEDMTILDRLLEYGEMTNTKVIFDKNSYRISSSKQLSNDLFEHLGLPVPAKYPNCKYPIIVKPDNQSGSLNVFKAFSRHEAEGISAAMADKAVMQEYMEGRSFSIEVLGDGEHFYLPEITEVITDESYDCKRIVSPAKISKQLKEKFLEMARIIAGALKINGIFDIEVIENNGTLRILEIDARFPSQTPISVYHSSGINMVQVLVELVLGTFHEIRKTENQVCCYQQIVVDNFGIKVLGEHVMGDCRDLITIDSFFGADVGITDYKEGCVSFKAIIIVTADTYEKAYGKFLLCIDRIKCKMQNDKLTLIEG